MSKQSKYVAVIGMSGMFPEADDIDQFFDNLKAGRDSVREISDTRLKYSTLYPFYNYQEIAHLDRVDLFDHAFFGMSKKEAECMDPSQRILLQLAVDAILNAGYALSDFKGSATSVYLGSGVDSKYGKYIQDFDPAILTGNLNSMGAGRIAYHLDLRGAAMMVGTACSSSLVAIHHACNDILSGDADYSLAGGFHILHSFARKDEINKLGTESMDGRSKTFDERADGTGGGEGGGLILLKRLDHALRDGDNIHAVIRGSATNQDGRTSNGLTAPSPVAQTAVLLKAWQKAGVEPETIEYIEAHGTGTKLGDPIEFKGITDAFASFGINSDHKCAVSSVKTNIGHLDNAAGFAGVIKAVLAVKHSVLFPSLHFESPNPFIDFQNSAAYVNAQLTSWKAKDKRVAGVSSFGISGTNAHLVLEEAPIAQATTGNREDCVLKISGKSQEAYYGNLMSTYQFLNKLNDQEWPGGLYTLNTGRDDFKFRKAFFASNKQQLLDVLQKATEKAYPHSTPPAHPEEGAQLIYLISGDVISRELLQTLRRENREFDLQMRSFEDQVKGDVSDVSYTVMAQLALFKVMEDIGLSYHSIIATGIGRATRELVTDDRKLLQVIDQLEKDPEKYNIPLDEEKLRHALHEIGKVGTQTFVEIGTASGVLAQTLVKNLASGENVISLIDVTNNSLISSLANMYSSGVIIDWKKLYKDQAVSRTALPGYSFDSIRCWHKEPVENSESFFNDWLYHLEWTLADKPEKRSVAPRKWLVMMADHDLGRSLVKELVQHKHAVITVIPGEEFKKIDEDSYSVSPASEQDYVELIKHLTADGNLFDGIIHLGNCYGDKLQDPNLEQQLQLGIYSQFVLAKVLDQKLSKSAVDFLMVSTNAFRVTSDEVKLYPVGAAAQGFLRSLDSEYPMINARVIDVDAIHQPAEILTKQIFDEIAIREDYKVVAYRNEFRFIQSIAKIEKGSLPEKIHFEAEAHKNYLITGGLHGIGYEIAASLASNSCGIIIVGRTKLPEESAWKTLPSDHVHFQSIKKLSLLQKSGARVKYYSCNIADDDEVALLKQNMLSESPGGIHGIIHAAALPGSKRIKNNTLEEFSSILSSRVNGSYNLVNHFSEFELDFLVLFSSLSGVLPANPREADYAAGCTIVNEYGKLLTASNKNVKVINWCAWQDTGMLYRLFDDKEQLLRANKPLYLNSKTGVKVFKHILSSDVPQAMVMANPQLFRLPDLSKIQAQRYFSMDELLGIDVRTHEKAQQPEVKQVAKPEHNYFKESVAQLSATELQLGKIWGDILKLSSLEKADDFFAIGGNSINGFQVVTRIESVFGVSIEVEDLFEFLSLEELAAHIDQLLAEQKEAESPKVKGLPVFEEQEYYKVSHAQRRLWVLDQLEGASASYSMPALFEIEEQLDITLLNDVFINLIARHESLRTAFIMTAQGPMQKILAKEFVEFNINIHDLREAEQKEDRIKIVLSEVAAEEFDLTQAPLIKVHLIQVEDRRFLLFINMHHIISDGWSLNVFFREMMALYFGLKNKGVNPLSPLKYQYKDHAIQQNLLLQKNDLNEHREYWLKQFLGELPVLNFPKDRQAKSKSLAGNRFDITLDEKLCDDIQQLVKNEHCTSFMVILSVLKVLLYKYTSQSDIVIGTPLAERSHPDLEDQIGMYLDNLAIRTQFNPEDSFLQVLKKVKTTTLGAFSHKNYPFDRLVEDLELSRVPNKFPLFDIGLTWNSQKADQRQQGAGVQIKGKEIQQRSVKTDIWFYGNETNKAVNISIEYNKELFHDQKIVAMLGHFKYILEQVVVNPNVEIKHLNLLLAEERAVLLNEFNGTATGVDSESTMIDNFHKVVESLPDQEAIVFENTRLTYKEVNDLANALAKHLRDERGVRAGDMVAVYGHRSEKLIISILAALKLGATYVPIDVSYPKERVGYILWDANISMLLTESELFLRLSELYKGEVFSLDLELEELTPVDENLRSDQFQPAYVIYTSGSSGRPKGVMVSQESVSNVISDQIARYNVDSSDAIFLFFPVSFDASMLEVYMALFSGATLVILSEELIANPKDFVEYIREEGVTVGVFPPGYLNLLKPIDLDFMRVVVSGGETPKFDQTLEFTEYLDYYNVYGPTETTICVTAKKVGEDDRLRGVIPIGEPLTNIKMYILDQNQKLLPIGTPGEICVSGPCVAMGYLNQPELTHEAFVNDPFGKGEKMYKTGDKGVWHRDGVVEFIGRIDRQVKIRGYRIELSEIETVISKLFKINNCVLARRDEGSKMDVLVAYLVSNSGYTPETVRKALADNLPDYMIPAHFIEIPKIPLTNRGKVDYEALPDHSLKARSRTIVEPANSTEERLLTLWKTVLGDKEISTKDNFFEIGGNSLKAIELVGEINNLWKTHLQLKDLFAQPTIEEQAILVRQPASKKSDDRRISRVEEQDHYPASYAQQGVYLLTRYEKQAVPYNVSKYFKLNNVDTEAFELAVTELIKRHDSLRSTFHYVDGDVRQKICPVEHFKFKVNHDDLRKEQDPFRKLTERMDQEIRKIFKKEKGPLWKLFLFYLPDNRFVLLVLIDHIISDGWSMSKFTNDLTTLYRGFATKQEALLEPLKIQYQDYASWQMEYLSGGSFEALKQYWDERIKGKEMLIDFTSYSPKVQSPDRILSYRESILTKLPKYFKPMNADEKEEVMGKISGIIPFDGAAYRAVIKEDVKDAISSLAQSLQVSMFSIVLASVKTFIYSFTKKKEITVVVPVSTRDQEELSGLIGWLINKVLVTSELHDEQSVEDCIKQSAGHMFEAMDHSTYPFSKLLCDYDLSLEAVSSVLVHYLGYDTNQQEQLTDFKSEHVEFAIPSFDLNFTFYEFSNGIEIVLEYRTAFFDAELIEKFVSDYLLFVENMVKNPKQLLASVSESVKVGKEKEKIN